MAPHCSNFEIAWSDGSTATDEIDLNSDGVPEIRQGDLVWFDITRADPESDPNDDGADRTTWLWYYTNHRAKVSFTTVYLGAGFAESTFRPLPEVGWAGSGAHPPMPGVRLNTTPSPGSAWYSPDFTGGVPTSLNGDPDANEFLTVWGYRPPNADPATGEMVFRQAWAKNLLIRLRVTLHDTQNRIEEGKTYEFVYEVNPSRN